jgi:ribosomal protein S6--L-glutamate ligase
MPGNKSDAVPCERLRWKLSMIVSYHPCFEADTNILCAGRTPDGNDLAAMCGADAVILPQGCPKSLYKMARDNCAHIFPGYGARFDYPGKLGQTRLFAENNVRHPYTLAFADTNDFHQRYGPEPNHLPIGFPLVFKFDWGGEGETVFLVESKTLLNDHIKKAARFEKTGQKGFLIQEYIPCDGRSLRVVVIGETMRSYWRVHENRGNFLASISKGAHIDAGLQPDLQKAAIDAVAPFCRKTGINLAGFDFLFSSKEHCPWPLFLEINYFFGRKGLGGSEQFYKMLIPEIKNWIARQGVTDGQPLPGTLSG